MAEKPTQPINKEVLSKELEQLRKDFPSFLKQPIAEGLRPPRNWLLQGINHNLCAPGEEAALLPHEIYVTIPRDTASDELRARRIAAQTKVRILENLERMFLVGGLDLNLNFQNGLFTLPGDPPLRKAPGQGAWEFCKQAIESYRNSPDYDKSVEKPLNDEDSEPGLVLMIHIKLRAKLIAQGGSPEGCEIDAASGKIKLDGVRVLGSDLILDDNAGMVIPRSSFTLLLNPDLKCRISPSDPSSILVNYSANMRHEEGFLWDSGMKDVLIYLR